MSDCVCVCLLVIIGVTRIRAPPPTLKPELGECAAAERLSEAV